MKLVRIGREVLNLRHVIRTQEDVPDPGMITVHTLPGDTFVVTGQEAQDLRSALLLVAPPCWPQGTQSMPVPPTP